MAPTKEARMRQAERLAKSAENGDQDREALATLEEFGEGEAEAEGRAQGREKGKGKVDLLEDYDTWPGEQVAVVLEQWLDISRAIARLRGQIRLKLALAAGARKSQAKELRKEATEIQERLEPHLQDLDVVTWAMVDTLEESDGARKSEANWRAMVPPLRRMVAKGLRSKGVTDHAETLARVERDLD